MGAENPLRPRRDCEFCVSSPDKHPHFGQLGVQRIDRVAILETENILVWSNILPVSPDGLHLLMIPRGHAYSLAARPELGEEAGRIISTVEEKFGQPFAFFEHGGVEEGSSVQSVYHQHGHLIKTGPFDVLRYMSDILRRYAIEHRLIYLKDQSPVENLQTLFKGQDYLYIQQGRAAIMAHDGVTGFPSQIAQKSMGRLLGHEVDWKNIPNSDHLAGMSVRRILSLIETCKQINLI